MEKKRWLYAVIGVIILLFAGLVYAWSVLSGPIKADFGWSQAEITLPYTIVMIFFCIGCVASGALASRIPARIYVWISAALFLIGFLISANISNLIMLVIGFGVICGFASGLAYSAVMSTVGKWFPDKQGLISGILLMGFGISSFVIGKLYDAFTPDTFGAWRTSFTVIGIVIAAVMAVCGFFIKKPGPDFDIKPAADGKKHRENPAAIDANAGLMLRQPSFWLYLLWVIFMSAAGLALISQAKGVATEAGVTGGTVATIVGLISIANGVSRIIFGGLYDKIGRSAVMQIVNALFIIESIILIFALLKSSFVLLVLGFVIGGAAYGGVTPTNSAFVSSYYGIKNYPLNFSIINCNLLIASFGSNIAAKLYDASGSFRSIFIMIIICAVVGIAACIGIDFCDRAIIRKKAAAAEKEA
ncbi:MAG: OFA family MFS transporter [Oscillospiraceae bacterium]|nr:OFA family MFS transporter [Oscillospiraceae bacterium]